MVYTIKFHKDEPPSYDHATASYVNETTEIKNENATTTSKNRHCGGGGGGWACFGFYIGMGMFKMNFIFVHWIY